MTGSYNLRSTIFLFVLLCCCRSMYGQEFKYELGGSLGTAYYNGDLGRKALLTPHRLSSALLYRYNANFRWALTSRLSYQSLSSEQGFADNVFPNNPQNLSFVTQTLSLTSGAEFHFLPLSDKFRYYNTSSFSPYLYTGLGTVVAWRGQKTALSPLVSLGLGAKYKLSSRWLVSLSWRYHWTLTDKLDALSDSSEVLSNPYRIDYGFMRGNDAFGQLSIGLTYSFGRRVEYHCP